MRTASLCLLLLLTGCWKAQVKLFQLPLSSRTNKAIGLVRDEKKSAAVIMDTTIKLYPEFSHRTEFIRRDTIIIPKVEIRTEFRDKPVVDSIAIGRLVAQQLTAMDSLKFLLSDRVNAERILTRKAMEFVNAYGLVTKDTLTADTLGIRMRVYIVKNNIIAEVRQSENRIPCPDAVQNQTDIKPAYIQNCEWWSMWQSWIACGIILLLAVVLVGVVFRL